jgi:predicted DNA-binding transcriptional regulator AlpA
MAQLFCRTCGCEQRLITVYQAALLIGVSRATLYHWMKRGWIHWLELPSKRRLICLQSLSHTPSHDREEAS